MLVETRPLGDNGFLHLHLSCVQAMGPIAEKLQFVRSREFPQRVKCAMLPWRAFEQALKEQQSSGSAAEVTTESPD